MLISKWDKFSRWTAASGQHHNLLGGLLVHTSEVVSQSMILANYWDSVYGKSVGETNKSDEIQKQANAELPCIKNETTSSVENNPNANNNNFINMPLLISGALLHDLGKVEELGVDALTAKTEYTERASLETHITIVASMIDIEAYKLCIGYKTEDNQKSDETIEKEKEAITLLKHLIFSHHGKLEYGSCIAPHTPEAEILNTADELSAKMFKYNRAFKNIQPATSEKKWASDGLVVCYKDSSKK